MKKKKLAELAVRLYHNIDQAEQFDVIPLFYHCDNKFLLQTIEHLVEAVKENVAEKGKRFSERSENVCANDKELAEMFALVEKALKGGIRYA